MATLENTFEYQVNQAIKIYKEQMESNATNDDLFNELWNNKKIFGEIMLNIISDYGMFNN